MSVHILADDRPTARRQHICSDCGRTIESGERYRRQRNIGDDGPYVWKACGHCDVVFDWIMETDPYAGEDWGVNVRDYLDYADGVGALRESVQNGWRDLTVDDVRRMLAEVQP